MPNDYSEAEALAAQGRALDDARRRTAEGPSMDAALARPNLADMVPPGTSDPQKYLADMIGLAESSGWYTRDNHSEPARFPQPRALTFYSAGGMTTAPTHVKPGDVVELDLRGDGTLTTIEVEHAVALGIVERDPNGGYRPIAESAKDDQRRADAQRKELERQQYAQELEAKRATGDEPDANTQAAIEEMVRIVPAPAQQVLIEEAIVGEGISLSNLEKLAKSVGVPMQRAMDMTENVVSGLREQAALAISQVGVPRDQAPEVWDWLYQNHRQDHINASRAFVMQANAEPLRALARKYLAARGQH